MKLEEYIGKYVDILETRKRCYTETRDDRMRGIENLSQKSLAQKGMTYGYGIAQYSLDAVVNDARIELLNDVIRDLCSFVEHAEKED